RRECRCRISPAAAWPGIRGCSSWGAPFGVGREEGCARISTASGACKPRALLPVGTAMIDRQRLDEICREAGNMALRQWPGGGHALESWEKLGGSPVCAADLAVDAFLRRELGALLPAAGWLSEETVDH